MHPCLEPRSKLADLLRPSEIPTAFFAVSGGTGEREEEKRISCKQSSVAGRKALASVPLTGAPTELSRNALHQGS